MACSVQGLELIVDSQFFGHILDGVSQCDLPGAGRNEEKSSVVNIQWNGPPLP